MNSGGVGFGVSIDRDGICNISIGSSWLPARLGLALVIVSDKRWS